jgi:hypothetical protein
LDIDYYRDENEDMLPANNFHFITFDYSPVISCIGEGTTEWQRFGYPKVFIRVPGVTISKSPSIPLEENVLEHFEVCYQASALKI